MKDSSLTPSACNYAALRRATRGIGQLYDQALAPCGLNAAQFSLLNGIKRFKGKPSQSDLAAELVMDLSALGHTLKPLIRDGFVDVIPDATDGRKKRIVLTAAGKTKLAEAARLQKSVHQRFERAAGREEAEAFRAMLDRLASPEFAADFAR
jgi:DNA-binding MarR family transcriptional regulator